MTLFTLALSTAIAVSSETAPAAGWVLKPASLLLFDSSGTLVTEIGLGQWKDESSRSVHAARAGVSKDSRFAWAWEKSDSQGWGAPAHSRLLRYFGTDGGELWRSESADEPKGLAPALLNESGDRLLVAERSPDGWSLSAYDWTGTRLVGARAPGQLELMLLSPLGRFAVGRWKSIDLPPVYRFFDLDKRRVSDGPVDKRPNGPLRVDDAGQVWAGEQPFFRFP